MADSNLNIFSLFWEPLLDLLDFCIERIKGGAKKKPKANPCYEWPLFDRLFAKRSLGKRVDSVYDLAFQIVGKIVFYNRKASNEELEAIESIMQRIGLSIKQKVAAFRAMHDGAATSNESLIKVIEAFFQRYGSSYERCLALLDFLIDVASADGVIAPEMLEIIGKVARTCEVPKNDFNRIVDFYSTRRLEEQAAEPRRTAGFSSAEQGTGFTVSLQRYYETLGCSQDSSLHSIKSAYRKLVMQYHPDRFLGEGAREETVKFYNEKFIKVQEAYDKISEARRTETW